MNIQDWFPLGLTGLISLTVQGTLKSILQHHSSKASILWRSAFFMVDLSPPYMTTGKNIALTLQTFVGKVMSLLFNTLSRFVIALVWSESSSVVSDSVIPWTIQSMEFSRPEFWSGLPFPSPADLPNPWIEPSSCLWTTPFSGFQGKLQVSQGAWV